MSTSGVGDFDDQRLDDTDVLAGAEEVLRGLAEAGSRVRNEANASATAMAELPTGWRPRAVVVAGRDARLLRAVLEPWCPVPFVAWPGPSLPGWAGALDLVVAVAPGGNAQDGASAAAEAVRRGCGLVVACPAGSALAEASAGRWTVMLPTVTEDVLAVCVVVLQALHTLGLGPQVDAEEVAEALVSTAVSCAPRVEVGANPGKDLAIQLADSVPLVWGGSVLAARAGRRLAQELRQATGRAALAGDADHLVPVIDSAARPDIFADPFVDGELSSERRPCLLILDDGSEEHGLRTERSRLLAAAEANGVRHELLRWAEGRELTRYAALRSIGQYASVYLAVGLGRVPVPES